MKHIAIVSVASLALLAACGQKTDLAAAPNKQLPPPPATLILTRDQPALVARGKLRRVRRGVYVDAAAYATLAPWERYLLRVHAVLHTWTDPLFCLESAAILHRLPTFGEPRDIHLLSTDGRSWRRGDVIVHSASDGRDVHSVEGVHMTGVADTESAGDAELTRRVAGASERAASSIADCRRAWPHAAPGTPSTRS